MDLLQILYKITKNVILKGENIEDLKTIKDFIDLIPIKYLIENGETITSSDFTRLQDLIQNEIDIQNSIINQ